MSQSKKHSHYEVIVNQIVGIVLGWLIVYFAFPLIGIAPSIGQTTASSAMFFVSSYARAYFLRRVFNKRASV